MIIAHPYCLRIHHKSASKKHSISTRLVRDDARGDDDGGASGDARDDDDDDDDAGGDAVETLDVRDVRDDARCGYEREVPSGYRRRTATGDADARARGRGGVDDERTVEDVDDVCGAREAKVERRWERRRRERWRWWRETQAVGVRRL